ncbi:hypothetical protein VFC49_06900 [Thermococcus sp. SY098]|uniref:hypothetical protein n=1 Tax=Thermococcus sp. SY098 TaxID=3111325 RepID=UPI002D78093A|nr:hypothetical protein [Thermococcus sp. SY098]WRS51813.1 hypothetical protein VFC49_06900 [Thermococcus sp. SY098]
MAFRLEGWYILASKRSLGIELWVHFNDGISDMYKVVRRGTLVALSTSRRKAAEIFDKLSKLEEA